MQAIRRRMRLWAFAWFVCQALTLVALVPRDCCAHHRPIASAPTSHHGSPAAAPETPACPMHAATAPATTQVVAEGTPHDRRTEPRGTTTPLQDDCVLRGTCDGPPLFTLFTHAGVLPDLPRIAPRVVTSSSPLLASTDTLGRAPSPDSPPPRLTSPHA